MNAAYAESSYLTQAPDGFLLRSISTFRKVLFTFELYNWNGLEDMRQEAENMLQRVEAEARRRGIAL